MKRTIDWLAAGVMLAALPACRPPIPQASLTPQRAQPESGPGVQACWVETRARFGFTASALVVRHDHGDLVIDGGNSTHFKTDIEPYEGGTKRWLAVFPGALRPKRPLADQLRAVRVDPAQLRWVLPTHAHLDHLGGLLDVPKTPVLLDPEEIKLVERGRNELIFEVMPAHAEAIVDRIEPLTYTLEPYEIFDRHADLFGDGSVVVVPLAGHTPGSVGVFVRLADGRRVFHVGDAVNARKQITELRGRTRALRRTDNDRARADSVVASLHALAARSDVLLLPAHERAAWRAIFGTPNRACGRS